MHVLFFSSGAIYLMDADTMIIGWSYIAAAIAQMVIIYIWCLGSMPGSMQQRNGLGSSYLYDSFCCCCGGGGSSSTHPGDEALLGTTTPHFCQRHIGTDLQAGAWLFFLSVAGPTLLYGYFMLFVAPGPSWFNFLDFGLLAAGALFFVRSFYPSASPVAQGTALSDSPTPP